MTTTQSSTAWTLVPTILTQSALAYPPLYQLETGRTRPHPQVLTPLTSSALNTQELLAAAIHNLEGAIATETTEETAETGEAETAEMEEAETAEMEEAETAEMEEAETAEMEEVTMEIAMDRINRSPIKPDSLSSQTMR